MIGRRIGWGVWLLFAAALYLFENNGATLTLLIASVLLPVLFLLLARHDAGTVRGETVCRSTCAKGDAVSGTVRLSRRTFGIVRGTLVCENRLTGEISRTPFMPGKDAAPFTLSTAHCGVIFLTCEVTVEDPFGLWRSKPIACGTTCVTVLPELFYPAVTLAEDVSGLADSERYSAAKPGSDPSETFSVREYVPGDPIRQIHWKLSAKTDTMMMRELGLPILDQTLLVFYNTFPCPPHSIDAMAEVFLSLSRAMLDSDIPHTAAWAEDGQFVLTEICTDAEYRQMESRLLSSGPQEPSDALGLLLSGTPCAHTAIIAPGIPDGLRGNRVTVLTPDLQITDSGAIHIIPFTPDGLQQELRSIQL